MKTELIEKYLTPNKIDEASGAGTSYEMMWNTFWSKKSPLIYVNNEGEVLWSNSHEFPAGTPMVGEVRRDAQARGYIIMDMDI
jgi:hypothetical protein